MNLNNDRLIIDFIILFLIILIIVTNMYHLPDFIDRILSR